MTLIDTTASLVEVPSINTDDINDLIDRINAKLNKAWTTTKLSARSIRRRFNKSFWARVILGEFLIYSIGYLTTWSLAKIFVFTVALMTTPASTLLVIVAYLVLDMLLLVAIIAAAIGYPTHLAIKFNKENRT